MSIDKDIEVVNSCKECISLMKLDRPEYMFNTNLCVLHLYPEWSEEVVKALELLINKGITTKAFSQVRLSCQIKD